MNMNQINSFLAISKTLNFTAAARQLGIPQSTISRQINDLEDQLHVRLFYRTKRDVHLTDEGRTFLPFAREMADAADKGTRAVQDLRDGSTGHLSIAVVPASESFLRGSLRAFHLRYPDIVIDLDLISAGFTLMDGMDSSYDFYFLYGDMLTPSDEYENITTHFETIGLAMSRDLLERISGGDPDKLDENLPSSDFILMSEEADPIVYMQAMNYCRTHRFVPRVVNSFSDHASITLALECGMGVSILPQSLIREKASDDLIFIPLEDDSYRIPCVAAWNRALLNPAAGLFLQEIKGSAD